MSETTEELLARLDKRRETFDKLAALPVTGYNGAAIAAYEIASREIFDAYPALAAALREAITECRRRKGWDQDIAYWKERAEELEEYAEHAPGCMTVAGKPCTCGLDDLFAEVRP